MCEFADSAQRSLVYARSLFYGKFVCFKLVLVYLLMGAPSGELSVRIDRNISFERRDGVYMIKHLKGVGTAQTLIEAKLTALIMSETLPGHFRVMQGELEVAAFLKGRSTHGKRREQQRAYQANKRYTEKQKAKAMVAKA